MFDRTKKNPGDPAQDSTPASTYVSPASTPVADSSARPATSPPGPVSRSRATAIIGPSIQIDGHLRGQEDVFVEGEVTGTIHLQNNTLTIGAQGKIKADVYAHTVFVEGSMDGDLFGSEQVIVRKTAKVRGNITSPRVSLEDGAAFKGSIEMDPDSVKSVLQPATSSGRSSTAPTTASTSGRPAATPQPVAAAASSTPIGSASGQSR